MAKRKPYLCERCGENRMSKFNIDNKSACKKCIKKKVQKTKEEMPPPTMSPEEQDAYCDNATNVMRDNLALRRKLLYG